MMTFECERCWSIFKAYRSKNPRFCFRKCFQIAQRTGMMGARVDRKFPDRKWARYWSSKKALAKKAGIEWRLSLQERVELSHELSPEYPSLKGWHLGRIDHTIGYTRDNVRWERAKDNLREGGTRNSRFYKRGVDGRFEGKISHA